MRLTTGGVLLTGAAAYVLYQAFKLKPVANLNFFPGTIHSFGFMGSTPVMQFDVVIQNTSSSPVLISAIAGNLYSNDILVGNVSNFIPVTVPALGQVTPTFTAQFEILGIVNDLIQAWQYKNFVQNITFSGSANAQGIQIPLEIKMTVGG